MFINTNNTASKETKQGFFPGSDIPFSVEPRNENDNLHGEVIWNYPNGVVKRRMQYDDGVMLTDTWYFNDGVEKTQANTRQCSCSCAIAISEGRNPAAVN